MLSTSVYMSSLNHSTQQSLFFRTTKCCNLTVDKTKSRGTHSTQAVWLATYYCQKIVAQVFFCETEKKTAKQEDMMDNFPDFFNKVNDDSVTEG